MKNITKKELQNKAKVLDIVIDFNDNYDFDDYWQKMDYLISEVTGNLGFVISGVAGDSYVQCVCYSLKNFQWNVVLDNDVDRITSWTKLVTMINFYIAEKARVESKLK